MQIIIYNTILISQNVFLYMFNFILKLRHTQTHVQYTHFVPLNCTTCGVRSYNTLDCEFCVLTQKWSNQNTAYLYIILIGRSMTAKTILVLFMYYGG